MTDTLSNATVFTLGQAAKAVGIAKSTVHTAIKNGKLSASKNDGKYEIQAAELFRVWPQKSQSEEPESAGEALVQQAILEAEVSGKEREIGLLKEQISDLKNERDLYRQRADKYEKKSEQLLLEHEQKTEANLAEKSRAKKHGITPWILALVLIVLAGLLADRFGLISLLNLV